MNIGIDARMMGKGFGLGRYVEQLVTGLLQHGGEDRYVFFVKNEQQRLQIADCRLQIADCRIILCDIPWYSFDEQVKFLRIIKKEKIDLMHFPHWNIPLFYSDPFVVTIHDLTMYHFPRPRATTLGPMKFWIKDKAHRLVVKHAVHAAQRIIAPSEWTKQDVVQTLGVPKEKISVVYQAPVSDFRFQISTAKAGQADCRFDILGITKPYVLYVGAAYPHKNMERLLQAWALFQERHGDGYQLVLVGKEDAFYARVKEFSVFKFSNFHDTTSLLKTRKLKTENFSSLIFTGLVSEAVLSRLYAHAALFVFPSLYEGFGLPPLEAFVHGVPVAASTASCLPEILGEGAIYFDPLNIEQMAEVIAQGLLDEDVRFMLKRNAREELRRFSFERFIGQTIEAYEHVT